VGPPGLGRAADLELARRPARRGLPLVGAAIAFATRSVDRLGRSALIGLLVGLVGVVAIVGADFRASDTVALLEVAS